MRESNPFEITGKSALKTYAEEMLERAKENDNYNYIEELKEKYDDNVSKRAKEVDEFYKEANRKFKEEHPDDIAKEIDVNKGIDALIKEKKELEAKQKVLHGDASSIEIETNDATDNKSEEVQENVETTYKAKKDGRWEKIDKNTKSLPVKNYFSKANVDEEAIAKKTKSIFGIIIFGFIAYLCMLSSSYAYQEYGQYAIRDEENISANPFENTENKREESPIKYLIGAVTNDAKIDLDYSHFMPKVFATNFGILGLVALFVAVMMETTQSANKKMRVGREHGNKRLATNKDIKAYKRDFEETDNYNQLFCEKIGLSLDNKKCNRSANVLVIGGTGTGKTFKYVKPNLLQENCSMIITDPSGDVYNSFASFLMQRGHNVYLFNVNNFDESNYFNPLLNVYSPSGEIDEVKVDVLVDIYMKNAKAGKEGGSGDPFWDKAEKAFLTACIYYVLENDEIDITDKCFHTVLEKVQLAKAEMEDGAESTETILTKEIKSWQRRMEAEHRKIKTPIYYDTFLIAPEKTANTILITTAVDLQIFATDSVDRVTRYNDIYPYMNINFDLIAQTRTYVFLGLPQLNTAYQFLTSMFYSQMYGRLYDLGERILRDKYILGYRQEIPEFNVFDSEDEMKDFADNVTVDNIKEDEYINNKKIYHLIYKGKCYKSSFVKDTLVELVNKLDTMVWKYQDTTSAELPIHINFMLDEFKNIGEIPNFLTILSTSRKYRIGSHVILQDIAQAETMYQNNEHQTLMANVDTTIFLGSILPEDKKAIQEAMGKTTINQKSTSYSKSGASTSYTPTEVPLVSIDELEKINMSGNDNCYVMVRDTYPVKSKKLWLTKHPKFALYKSYNNGFPYKDYFVNTASKIY